MNVGNFTSQVETSFLFVFVISLVLLIGITVAMIYFIIRYHHTKNDKPKDIHGHTGLEIAWTVIPTILVMGMFYYGLVGYEKMAEIPEDAMEVKVDGRMWEWKFTYANGVTTDTLYVPVDQAVNLSLNSADVIHSFYIPGLKIKRDVVPGINNHMWFAADESKRYDVFCAEYCGDKHAYMYTQVVALPRESFDQWYASSGTAAPQVTSADTAQ